MTWSYTFAQRSVRLAVILALFTMIGATAFAETYVAGQAGVTLPQSLSDIDFTGVASGLTSSDLKLKDSVMYGAKVGHYFESTKWFGTIRVLTLMRHHRRLALRERIKHTISCSGLPFLNRS